MKSVTLSGMFDEINEINEKLDRIEETLDQLLDLARVQGFDSPEDPDDRLELARRQGLI